MNWWEEILGGLLFSHHLYEGTEMIVLMSKPSASRPWGVRSYFWNENSEVDASNMPPQTLRDIAYEMMSSWMACEPSVQYKIVTDFERPRLKENGYNEKNARHYGRVENTLH